MPHYYSASGTPIQLDESSDDIGIRFGHEDGAVTARLALRAIGPAGRRADEPPARRFGRFMLLHDTGAGAAPVETVVNALPGRLASRVARTMPVFVERESQLKLVATEQILVCFKAGAPAAARRKLLAGLDLAIAGRSEFDPDRHVVVPTSLRRAARTLDLANELVEADDVVAFAAPNFLAEMKKGTVNDPLFVDQWHLDNRGQSGGRPLHDVRALGAWAVVGGGLRSIVVAIIDDGVDLKHPDLIPNLWHNPSKRARDRHGRDFLDDIASHDPSPKVFNPPYDDTDLNDIHGTPCAGVAAARGNNRKGVSGIAWNCRIMAVKIMSGLALAPNDRIADSIRYASRHADVLSCSWGVARHPDIEAAIGFAVTKGRRGRGSLLFAATGNESRTRVAFPASDDRAIAVGACNDRGVRSRYSNFGTGIDVVAPSDDNRRPGITTTDVSRRGRGYADGLYCSDFGGTSSATPLAAGAGALVLSADRTLLGDEAREILRSTAEPIDRSAGGYRKGYSLQYGFGRVNAEAAVAQAQARKTKARGRRRR